MVAIESAEELEKTKLSESDLEELYTWIDSIPLSRPKRNLARDFSDGVMVAEVIKHRFQRLVDLHNYTTASNSKQKMQNWRVLNNKVFSKLNLELSEEVMQEMVAANANVIQPFLCILRTRLDLVHWDTKAQRRIKGPVNDRPEVDQNSFSRISSLKDASAAGTQGGVTFASTVVSKGSRFPQDETVPQILLEEKEHEVLMKDETIQILQNKIKRLEHLLHLKDIRIEDMQKRLESTRVIGKR